MSIKPMNRSDLALASFVDDYKFNPTCRPVILNVRLTESCMRFDINPGIGALPIRFGMRQREVRSLLGPPETSSTTWDKSATTDYWLRSCVNVGYDNKGVVNHIGFSPGDYELLLRGSVIWSPNEHPDPNPQLLEADPTPMERLGFLVFNRLSITTTGYHDDDESQRALTAHPHGKWNELLTKAVAPDLGRYL